MNNIKDTEIHDIKDTKDTNDDRIANIKTHFMLLDNAGKYNTGGRYHMAPFSTHPSGLFLYIKSEYLDYINGTLFYRQILQLCKPLNPNGPTLHTIPTSSDLPCTYMMHPDRCLIFSKVHQLHLDWYDATHWAEKCLPSPIYMVKYNSIEQEALNRLAGRYIQQGPPSKSHLDKFILDNDLQPLCDRIQQAIDNTLKHPDAQCKDGVFIKLANFSPKKTTSPYPITTVDETLKYLLSSPRCQAGLGCRAIMVRPWEPAAANFPNEFRAFIQDNQLVGISQQNIYNCYPAMASVYSKMGGYIADQIQKMWDMQIKPNTDYRDGTLDVYCDPDNEAIRLIEINPYGSWSGAGAAWYEWITDPPQLGQPLELRITTNIPH